MLSLDTSEATHFPYTHYIQLVDISSEDCAAVEQLTDSLEKFPPVSASPTRNVMLPTLEKIEIGCVTNHSGDCTGYSGFC